MKYYKLDEIQKHNALYNMVFGERSNGKTTAGLMLILKNWIEKGEQGAYLRRYDEDIKGRLGEAVFTAIANELDLVNKWTDGAWDGIKYYNRRWYLTKYDSDLDTQVSQEEPFCFAFAINQGERYKSTTYPNITTIVFDEFLTRDRYIINEFVEFINILSTIIRQRDNVKVYMFGNTVNKFCPYFNEMGLHKINEMRPGDIDIYEYGKSKLTVAVEYCGTNLENRKGKKSDKYFAFNNPKLKMITTGAWELPMYPHAPMKIDNNNILDFFFVEFSNKILQGNIILQDDMLFIYLFEKTTPIKDDIKQTYSLNFKPQINHAISPLKGFKNKLAIKISELIRQNNIFYQSNEVGEIFRNYILESNNRSPFNL